MKVEKAVELAMLAADNPYSGADTFLASLRANGWELAPIEATEKMRLAGCGEMARQTGATYSPAKYQIAAVWRTMLAAAHTENDDGR